MVGGQRDIRTLEEDSVAPETRETVCVCVCGKFVRRPENKSSSVGNPQSSHDWNHLGYERKKENL